MEGVSRHVSKNPCPLDRSQLAECAIPHVRNLLRCGLSGEVTLLNVIEIPPAYLARGYDITAIKANHIFRHLTVFEEKGIGRG